jgi:hypothetical protein
MSFTMDDYTQQQVDKLKRMMRATDVHFDLLGITLTIDGQPVFIPTEAMSALGALTRQAETQVLDRVRREMAAERGPY